MILLVYQITRAASYINFAWATFALFYNLLCLHAMDMYAVCTNSFLVSQTSYGWTHGVHSSLYGSQLTSHSPFLFPSLSLSPPPPPPPPPPHSLPFSVHSSLPLSLPSSFINCPYFTIGQKLKNTISCCSIFCPCTNAHT